MQRCVPTVSCVFVYASRNVSVLFDLYIVFVHAFCCAVIRLRRCASQCCFPVWCVSCCGIYASRWFRAWRKGQVLSVVASCIHIAWRLTSCSRSNFPVEAFLAWPLTRAGRVWMNRGSYFWRFVLAFILRLKEKAPGVLWSISFMVLWLDTHEKLEEGSRSDPEPSLTKFLIESSLEIEESDPEVLQSIYLTSFIRKSLLEVEEIDPGELQSSSRWISNYIHIGNPESLVWCRSEVGKSLILWFP